jgi:hypothetical protein
MQRGSQRRLSEETLNGTHDGEHVRDNRTIRVLGRQSRSKLFIESLVYEDGGLYDNGASRREQVIVDQQGEGASNPCSFDQIVTAVDCCAAIVVVGMIIRSAVVRRLERSGGECRDGSWSDE